MAYHNTVRAIPLLLLCNSASYTFVTAYAKEIHEYVNSNLDSPLHRSRVTMKVKTGKGPLSNQLYQIEEASPYREMGASVTKMKFGEVNSLSEQVAVMQQVDSETMREDIQAAVEYAGNSKWSPDSMFQAVRYDGGGVVMTTTTTTMVIMAYRRMMWKWMTLKWSNC